MICRWVIDDSVSAECALCGFEGPHHDDVATARADLNAHVASDAHRALVDGFTWTTNG